VSDEVLTVREAAQLLKVSPWTIRDCTRRGVLPGIKVGREYRYSRSALLARCAPDVLPPTATPSNTARRVRA
jgi:excisionase family DNA binding protein